MHGPLAGLVTALLAVLKAGAAYLPVDPSYPPARIAYMLADAGPAVILATTAAAAGLPVLPCWRPVPVAEVDGRVPAVRGPGLRAAAVPGAGPGWRVRPANAAYVMYTSGSTGRPKGVVVTHGGVANLVAGAAGGSGWGRVTRVLQFAPSGFDASVWELCGRCWRGRCWWWRRRGGAGPGGTLAGLMRGSG